MNEYIKKHYCPANISDPVPHLAESYSIAAAHWTRKVDCSIYKVYLSLPNTDRWPLTWYSSPYKSGGATTDTSVMKWRGSYIGLFFYILESNINRLDGLFLESGKSSLQETSWTSTRPNRDMPV